MGVKTKVILNRGNKVTPMCYLRGLVIWGGVLFVSPHFLVRSLKEGI